LDHYPRLFRNVIIEKLSILAFSVFHLQSFEEILKMSLTDDQQRLKQSLVDSGEEWNASFENIVKLDSKYFEAYLRLRQVPREKQALSIKVQELVLLAMDAAVTHLDAPGVRVHTAAALKAGASKEEILETLELSSVLGVHAVTVGVPTLMEVLAENGEDQLPEQLDENQQRVKNEFIKRRGYWGPSWDPVIRLSPAFFEAYMEFSSVPFRDGHNALDAKTKELMYTAIDCSTTHLYQPGLKVHIRNAVKYGATKEEIMEVFELAALMGVKTTLMGADALIEQLAKGP
jgi:alkylhydroperoxidase/carboxymuconolactone decarboxylase family protein YurZ